MKRLRIRALCSTWLEYRTRPAEGVVFQFSYYPFLYRTAEFNAVHIQPNEEVRFRRKVQRKTSDSLTVRDLCSQSVKLFRWRMGCRPGAWQLAFANRVHNFHPSDRTARRPKGLEALHRGSEPFHCPMILFHNVIKIF